MLLARQLNATIPSNSGGYFVQSNKAPEKNRGMNKKRFLAQSLGRSNFIYSKAQVFIGNLAGVKIYIMFENSQCRWGITPAPIPTLTLAIETGVHYGRQFLYDETYI
jgi:hypothetical protein